MTHNQIEYWKLQEQKTHNAATRSETTRTNLANEAIARDRNVETNRHNVQVEAIDQYRALEDARSNRARERETNRSNLANEAIKDREVSYKESVLPSEIARNYSYIGKAAGGLISDAFRAIPIIISTKSKSKDKDSNDSKPKGGSGSKVASQATQGSKYVTQTQREAEEAMNVIDRVLEELDRQNADNKRISESISAIRASRAEREAAKTTALVNELREIHDDIASMQRWSTRFLSFFGLPVNASNINAVSSAIKNLGYLGG